MKTPFLLAPRLSHRTVAAAAAVLLAAALLPACSDGTADIDTTASLAHAEEEGAKARAMARVPPTAAVAPLMDDDGTVLPSDLRAVPADPAARTQQQRYTTRQQAQALHDALQGDVIWVQVDCCDAAGIDLAVLTVYGMQAAKDLPNTAPVLVHGSNLRRAAAVADRLAEHRMSRVFLVTR